MSDNTSESHATSGAGDGPAPAAILSECSVEDLLQSMVSHVLDGDMNTRTRESSDVDSSHRRVTDGYLSSDGGLSLTYHAGPDPGQGSFPRHRTDDTNEVEDEDEDEDEDSESDEETFGGFNIGELEALGDLMGRLESHFSDAPLGDDEQEELKDTFVRRVTGREANPQ